VCQVLTRGCILIGAAHRSGRWGRGRQADLHLRGPTVTVGIAALCTSVKGGDTIICATDTQFSRGFTSSLLHLKTEQLMGTHWMVLLAADDLTHATDLIDELDRLFVEARLESKDTRDLAVTEAVLAQSQRAVRLKYAERYLPPGFSLERFYSEGQTLLPDVTYQSIWRSLMRPLACDLLVAGIDNVGYGAMLTVGEDYPTKRTREGFCSIGSGSGLALSILSSYDHALTSPWREAAYRVYAAKKASERAAGVGPWTVLERLTANGRDILSTDLLQTLVDRFGILPSTAGQAEIMKELEAADLVVRTVPWDRPPTEAVPGLSHEKGNEDNDAGTTGS